MSFIGYYRYKTTTPSTRRAIQMFKSGVATGVKYIEPIPFCEGNKILKYLDPNGEYRFYPFNKFYEIKDNPKSIGLTNKFLTNILTDQSSGQNIGYKNDRTMALTADVTNAELVYLAHIYTSPRVYLYIGQNNSDGAAAWLEVTVTGGDKTVRRRKANGGQIDITITLPEHYTIRTI